MNDGRKKKKKERRKRVKRKKDKGKKGGKKEKEGRKKEGRKEGGEDLKGKKALALDCRFNLPPSLSSLSPDGNVRSVFSPVSLSLSPLPLNTHTSVLRTAVKFPAGFCQSHTFHTVPLDSASATVS